MAEVSEREIKEEWWRSNLDSLAAAPEIASSAANTARQIAVNANPHRSVLTLSLVDAGFPLRRRSAPLNSVEFVAGPDTLATGLFRPQDDLVTFKDLRREEDSALSVPVFNPITKLLIRNSTSISAPTNIVVPPIAEKAVTADLDFLRTHYGFELPKTVFLTTYQYQRNYIDLDIAARVILVTEKSNRSQSAVVKARFENPPSENAAYRFGRFMSHIGNASFRYRFMSPLYTYFADPQQAEMHATGLLVDALFVRSKAVRNNELPGWYKYYFDCESQRLDKKEAQLQLKSALRDLANC